MWICVLGLLGPLSVASGTWETKDLEFFEKQIRPVLIERCYECHGPEKQRGGLRLDTRSSVRLGGESGPALVPGRPEESRLIQAILYRGLDLQMPPRSKLPDREIEALIEWVKRGAPDPRDDEAVGPSRAPAGIDIEKGREFWAYQPPQKVSPPRPRDEQWARNDIDRFILAGLEAEGIRPAAPADPGTLIRRAYYDLTGLPPTPEQIAEFVNDPSADAFGRVIDRLLAGPEFGERWGRHWLDVARYAESVTLRGLIFREAWRYRDYVIESFNRDKPFDRFIVEQIAGDLLPASSIAEAQQQRIATTFLVLGNTNLEEQDKVQLRMDVVDEQLDTIGKAFLGQALSCARCHDHKFDPIPTADYYAMAGILRNTRTLIDANVSNWIEVPLPLPPEQEEAVREHDASAARLREQIKTAKESAAQLAAAAGLNSDSKALAVAELPGVVVDDSMARRVGEWQHSQFTGRFIGDGYLHDQNNGKGEKTLTFQPDLPGPGKYEVRLAYVPGSNRAAAVPITIFSADEEITLLINQQETPPIEGRFVSLGVHRFENNNQGFVLISNEGTRGHVIADAVQFLPVDADGQTARAASGNGSAEQEEKALQAQKAAERVNELEAELKVLTANAPPRPRVMSVREESEIGDTYIHIRGSVHNQGPTVPRGFLQVATYGTAPEIPGDQSGRRELGEWIAGRSNPLTARVMVNRVWHWLFGAGLVRTTDNFGTTGEPPSHPELLDYLAVRFMEEDWSVKRLIRELMQSSTYQLSSGSCEEALALDPENRLFWRMNRRRLEAESIRDTMLFVSGELNREMGRSTIRAGTNSDYGYTDGETRRGVYIPVFRNALPELFELFDFADPSMVTGRRNTSTVAPQALFLLNHPFVMEQARLAAERLLDEDGLDDQGRIERAYRMTLGRAPSEAEKNLAVRFMRENRRGERGGAVELWTQLYQALFATIDFRHLD